MSKVGPTPRGQWVKVGDRCVSPEGWVGKVLRVIGDPPRIPTAKVQWEQNGHVGYVTITNLKRLTYSVTQTKET